MTRRLKTLLASVTLSVLVAVGLGSPPAHAEPIPKTPAEAAVQASCYSGGAYTKYSLGAWGATFGPYRTTSRCVDINIRNFSAYGISACVIFTDRTGSCNYWTYIPARSGWFVIATNVRDGVNFRVQASNSFYQYGPLEVQVAF